MTDFKSGTWYPIGEIPDLEDLPDDWHSSFLCWNPCDGIHSVWGLSEMPEDLRSGEIYTHFMPPPPPPEEGE